MAKAPGKWFRKGMTLIEIVKFCEDEEAVEKMFIEARWPNGVACPKCGSLDVQEKENKRPQPFRCRDCKKFFSVKTDTVMHGSNIALGKWALASYIMTTSLKGVSSMKLHRDLGITQKAAWHLTHRIRKAWADNNPLFTGPVEADETYIGGKNINKHENKKIKGRGAKGKTPIVGMVDRETNQIHTQVVPDTKKRTLQGFVIENTQEGAKVFTDEFPSYTGLVNHEVVKHKVGEYVNGMVHTNGIESHWAMLKRGIMGTYHHISPKHLDRYATEFAGRHNDRPSDTADQIHNLIGGMEGKRLRYEDLIA